MNSGIIAKLLMLAGILLLLPIAQVSAATITVGANCTFLQAWNSAFDDSAPSGSSCTAGSGTDTIVLNDNVVLADTIWEGGGGTVIINGNGNTISGDGTFGFISLWGGPTVTFNNITFTGGVRENGNGGAFAPYSGSGTYTFNDCVFHNNRVTLDSTGGNGGAINAGPNTTVNINRCAFYNNRAETGGAIKTSGVLTITNSSFYNNRAVREGGAISVTHTDTSRQITLRHVTMINNRGGTDSGALQFAAANVARLYNSILYGNTPRDCYVHGQEIVAFPALAANSGSFIGVANCDFEQRNYGNQNNPQLAGPFNGFYIPRAGSPVINSSSCLASTVPGYNEDQRGQPRPLAGQTNSQCDAGAIEHAGYTPPPPPQRSISEDAPDAGDQPADRDSDQQAAQPAISTCLTLDGIAAFNLSESTQCQRVNAMQIANPNIRDGDFVDAVDVWSWVTPDTQICFEASGGAFKFINTAVIPRTIQDWPAFARDGMTCASIDGPGILILMPGDPPEQAEPDSQPASQQQPLIARRLQNCMVTANASLNLRVRPHGRVYGGVAKGWTLTATARTDDWFQVDRLGQMGWIAAMYVTPEGDCG